jgi:hypothetical protein
MTLTMSLGSLTSSTRSAPGLRRLFAQTGPAGPSATAPVRLAPGRAGAHREVTGDGGRSRAGACGAGGPAG